LAFLCDSAEDWLLCSGDGAVFRVLGLLAQLPQLGGKIVDFSAKTGKVFTTFLSFFFPPLASEKASIDPAVVATRPDDRSAR